MPYYYPRLGYYRLPLFSNLLIDNSSRNRTSIEGLKIGDLIYFSDTNSTRLANLAVKFGNKLAFKSHLDYFQDIPAVYDTIVHVELVTDIDTNGRAIITSTPGSNSIVRKIGFLEYLQHIQDKKLYFDNYLVVRCTNAELALEAARQMQSYVPLAISYSRSSCLLTLVPRVLKQKSTSDTQSMMCQEIVYNVLHNAVQNLKLRHGSIPEYLPSRLKAQVTPGVGLYELLQTGFWDTSRLNAVADTTVNTMTNAVRRCMFKNN